MTVPQPDQPADAVAGSRVAEGNRSVTSAAVVGEAGSTEHEQIARVSPDFFATLGTRPSH